MNTVHHVTNTFILRNKMYYTQAGGVDLLKAKWRKLSELLSVECDGVDIIILNPV